MSTWYEARLIKGRAVIDQRDISECRGEDERRLCPIEAEARAFARDLLNRVKSRCARELADAEKQLAALEK